MHLLKLFEIDSTTQVLLENLGWVEDKEAYVLQISIRFSKQVKLTMSSSFKTESLADKTFNKYSIENARAVNEELSAHYQQVFN